MGQETEMALRYFQDLIIIAGSMGIFVMVIDGIFRGRGDGVWLVDYNETPSARVGIFVVAVALFCWAIYEHRAYMGEREF